MSLAFTSAGAAEGLVRSLAAEAGVAIDGRFGAVGAMLETLDAGEHADVVILTHEQVERLAIEGRVVRASAADIGVVATAIAVPRGHAAPDISTAQALRAAVLAADAIHIPDPARSTAGGHFARVLERLGLTAQVATRLHSYPNGRTAMKTLAEASGHPIGCTQATEILATAGLALVGPLPPGCGLETIYTAAVDARARDREAAAAFVARLTGPTERGRREACGFR